MPRKREQIDVFVRLLFVLDLDKRKGAHWFARTARMQRAKRLTDRAVLERAAHCNKGVARMAAERDRERDLLLGRGAGGGEIGRASCRERV